MSAFVVSKAHIDALVTAALESDSWAFFWYHDDDRHELDYTNTDAIGAMLWAENVRSVQHRYPDILEDSTDYPGPIDFQPEHVFAYRWCWLSVPPVEALKALRCYQYQSCEHPDWPTSSAHALCDTLQDVLVSTPPRLPRSPLGDRRLSPT
jgi:hypothetical protein